MSRIIRFHQFGPADVLRQEERAGCRPGRGPDRRARRRRELERRALAAGDLAPRHARLPAGLGSEVAGEVLAVGEGVQGFSVGDRRRFPAHDLNQYPLYAEHALLPQQALVHYPDMLSASEAAIHYTPMLVSYFALVELAQLEPGQYVLINQAAHCTGPAAVQLAKALGGRVIATCDTSEDRDYLRELGAETVIVTEEEDLVGRLQKLTEGRGVEVVLDACGSQMKLLGDVMAPLGKLILYGMNGGTRPRCRSARPSRRTSVLPALPVRLHRAAGTRSSRTARPSNARCNTSTN